MSGFAEVYHPVSDPALKQKLSDLCQKHLEDNGDTEIRFTDFQFYASESTDKVDVYWVSFGASGCIGILEVSFFANGTHQIEEV
jgi:hypothetical protein